MRLLGNDGRGPRRSFLGVDGDMTKYWTTTHHHDYPWQTVAAMYWQRYPNPYSKHVFSEDFVERKLLDDGRLYTKRVLTKTNRMPKWGRHLLSVHSVPMIEEAVCDPKAMTLTTYTRNITFRYLMSVTERVTFSPDLENEDATLANKEVWINSEVFGLHAAIRSFGIDRFKRNALRATKGFDWVLEGNREGNFTMTMHLDKGKSGDDGGRDKGPPSESSSGQQPETPSPPPPPPLPTSSAFSLPI